MSVARQELVELAGQNGAPAWSQRTIVGLAGMLMCMLTLFMYVHDELPAPYMDEQFHVDQLHAYCAGNFSYVSTFIMLSPYFRHNFAVLSLYFPHICLVLSILSFRHPIKFGCIIRFF